MAFPVASEVQVQFIEDQKTSLWLSAMDVFFWLICHGYQDLAGDLARHIDQHPESRVSGRAVSEPDFRKWADL